MWQGDHEFNLKYADFRGFGDRRETSNMYGSGTQRGNLGKKYIICVETVITLLKF